MQVASVYNYQSLPQDNPPTKSKVAGTSCLLLRVNSGEFLYKKVKDWGAEEKEKHEHTYGAEDGTL